MHVKMPTIDEVVQAIELGRQMHAETVYRDRPFAPEKVLETVSAALMLPDKLALVAVTDRGEVVGFITATIMEYAFNFETHAHTVFFYVTPSKRGSKAHQLLLNAYKQWAFSLGCEEALASTASGIDAENYFNRKGFEKIGTTHRAIVEKGQ